MIDCRGTIGDSRVKYGICGFVNLWCAGDKDVEFGCCFLYMAELQNLHIVRTGGWEDEGRRTGRGRASGVGDSQYMPMPMPGKRIRRESYRYQVPKYVPT